MRFGKRIGIDLGTANVLVYEQGRGIVVNEPAVVALAHRDNTVVAVGNEARAMMGRTPDSISIIRPMRDGVIADYLVTEAMLRYFIGKAIPRFSILKPEVMVCIPAGVTSVEQRAVRDAAEQAGARSPAHLVPEPIAGAIGANLPIDTASGNMIVDIGGGRTEAAVISMYGMVAAESVRMAGDRLDDAIVAYVKRRHNLVIGERTAEDCKRQIGCAIPVDPELRMEMRGRDVITGMPRATTITSTEIANALQDNLAVMMHAIRSVLERTPPELASDVIDRGIVLTGGGALLRGIEMLISQETGIPCHIADHPLECVAIGAGIALYHLDIIKRNIPTEEEQLVNQYAQY
ncbi:MAG TPA: rod shape-determining protein [Dehalococcoidia bacterium]|nr:rod shape-determining protein [Dehalococcoidia bacterium]